MVTVARLVRAALATAKDETRRQWVEAAMVTVARLVRAALATAMRKGGNEKEEGVKRRAVVKKQRMDQGGGERNRRMRRDCELTELTELTDKKG